MDTANRTGETKEPVNRPNTASAPKRVPAIRGEPMTRASGAPISFSEDFAEIVIHLAAVRLDHPAALQDRHALAALRENCRFTFWTIWPAALPSDFMVRPANQYGTMAPTSREAKVAGSKTLMPLRFT